MNDKKLITILLPAYNEASILADNVVEVRNYLESNEDRYNWEIVIVNDGSSDETPELADACAAAHPDVHVVHHPQNRGLGAATRTGIQHSRGDYIIVLDVDLSYDVSHIGRIIDTLDASGVDVVLASPYMKGGTISNVPFLRKMLSIFANRFLATVAHGNLSTLTCMVRGFRGEFAKDLVLRSLGMDVMPETVYKSMILRGRIAQIPADLNWGEALTSGGRTSSMRILRQIFGTLLSGFLFRPFMFFILPGLLLLTFALYVNVWMLIHFFDALALLPTGGGSMERISMAVSSAYEAYPHTFIIGLLSMMLAVQLISLGILALQSKSYFEEVFYLGSSIRRRLARDESVTESHKQP